MEKRLSTDRKEQGDSPPFRQRKAHSVELDQPPSGEEMESESYGDEESDEYDDDYDSEANDTVPAPNDKRKSMQ